MAVNYNDERFQNINREKQEALNNVNNTYSQMINQSQGFYNDLINQNNQNAQTQKEIQQANTDFAIDKIEQQKDWLNKDYQKEQKGAYTDYQKQVDTYGVDNENMAASGLTNTGYSETSKLNAFNTYQNRYATARDSYMKAVQNYDNGIREAQLSNNAKLAEITANAQARALELALQGFQYKNSLLQSQLNAQQTTEDRYYSRWKDTLNQINTENALAEQKRQFNAQMSLQKKQATINKNSQISGSKSGSVTYDPKLYGKLSAKAQKLYNAYLTAYNNPNKLTLSSMAAKGVNDLGKKEVINSLYKNKQITSNDVYVLAQMFGLN